MLEKLRRARAIGKHPSAGGQIPLVHMGGSMDEFYAAIRDETKDARLLPNWRGELYAEFHRGTYTTHASIKKGNRKGEILLREAEHAATMASIASAPYHYPQKVSLVLWVWVELTLRNSTPLGRISCSVNSTMFYLGAVSA